MSRVLLSIMFMFTTASAFASQYSVLSQPSGLNFDFVAPIVASDSDVPMLAGLIYYDIGVGLKIINPTGAVETITSAGAGSPVVTSDTSVQNIVHARIAGATRSTVCSSSPCTVYNASGSWISSVTRAATGNYTVNFNTGTFSAEPACTINQMSIAGTGNRSHWLSTTDATSSSYQIIFMNSGGTAVDVALDIICMGSK